MHYGCQRASPRVEVGMADINFVDYDAQAIASDAIARFESILGVNLGDADERRMLLNAFLQACIQILAAINDAGRQNLLEYARGENLDAIGATRGVERLSAQPSATTLRFTLSAAQSVNVIIPEGTRVTPDGALFWATDKALSIPAGALTGEVAAACMEAGAATNGYAAGALSTLVDRLAYVQSVANTTATQGGADAESDDSYRERIRTSRAIYSTAGPAAAYEFYARSASALVQDVAVTSPGAGQVLLTVLASAGGRDEQGHTQQAVLDDVLGVVSGDTVRPLTDHVEVRSAEPVSYDIALKYYVTPATESQVILAVEGEGGAIEQYNAWQSAELGRSINPDMLRAYLIQAGAQWAEVTQPVQTSIQPHQYACVGTIDVTHEVIQA